MHSHFLLTLCLRQNSFYSPPHGPTIYTQCTTVSNLIYLYLIWHGMFIWTKRKFRLQPYYIKCLYFQLHQVTEQVTVRIPLLKWSTVDRQHSSQSTATSTVSFLHNCLLPESPGVSTWACLLLVSTSYLQILKMSALRPWNYECLKKCMSDAF